MVRAFMAISNYSSLFKITKDRHLYKWLNLSIMLKQNWLHSCPWDRKGFFPLDIGWHFHYLRHNYIRCTQFPQIHRFLKLLLRVIMPFKNFLYVMYDGKSRKRIFVLYVILIMKTATKSHRDIESWSLNWVRFSAS